MFSRCISAKLKADVAKQVPTIIQNDVLPLLRKQKGFRDEVVLISPDRSAVLSISFWDTKADAEAYDRTAFPEVLKAITKLVEGTPQVLAYEVTSSTFHKILAQTATGTAS
jgi:heme-degrading monooxygenase HmoA